MTDDTASYDTILVERRGRVGIITLNRPKALNALNRRVMHEVTEAAAAFDADPAVGCLVVTGSERAFAAGADIKEMAETSAIDLYMEDGFGGWMALTRIRKPIVAAVSGFALGGGCELAMMCDMIIASDTAKFGQPEIKLGIIPGIGGSQRLIRAIGKAKATDLCLTGRMMDAAEAERSGLVARVVPAADFLAEAMKTADAIAAMSLPALMALKECLGRSAETGLAEGLLFERRAIQALFATADRREGMAAFVEKRPPNFTHR
ncbi:enoyl-CoA hydratase [Lichenibacterium ramalinae]|uniref:enoyl-CoA hydratase n=1 Tax=Lichenibacterium ramalinae TaxID=2316527 RepID=A0A4Q2RDB8_9HYPH|nr:enoyl-CoA hydratase [Lichenibacterium ramalinae]RYB03932.1 enoyl-CoA hydratase [Lichenibacterium ramalinae]